MGVPGPFRGSRADWFAANGWRAVIHAQLERWDLREYPDLVPVQWNICLSNELMRAETRIYPSRSGGWVFDRESDFRGAPVDRFRDPVSAFRWWVEQRT